MNPTKRLFLIAIVCVLSSGVFAQKNDILLSVEDSLSGEPIEFVPVKLLSAKDSSLVGGVISDSTGRAILKNVGKGAYIIHATFFGYNDYYSDQLTIDGSKRELDFGTIQLSVSDETLDEVLVIGRREMVKYEIDKKVINVSENIANVSGTAHDVLSNSPSITTDSEGNLQLRGSSNFTLLIDGKLTQMDANDALRMMSASNIKNIEIMTNPSSKYQAEGVGGIINIVTKDNKNLGSSALISLGGGTYHNYNADLNYQLNREKVSFMVNANFRNRTSPEFQEEQRISSDSIFENTINSDGFQQRSRMNYGGSVGFEWRMNPKNVLNINVEYSGFYMKNNAEFDFTEYQDDSLVGTYHNIETGKWDFRGGRAFIDFVHYFNDKKDHLLIASAMYRGRYGDERVGTDFYEVNENDPSGGNLYTELGPVNRYQFQLDYQLPIKENYKFESGAQAQMGMNADNTKSFELDPVTQEYLYLPLFSTNVEYIRNVYAAYAMFGGTIKKFGFQTGLRAEYTDRTVTSTNAESTDIQRLDFFPAVHTSYQHSDQTQFMLSYSRKIDRPRGWYLEPFIAWTDLYSVRKGNPNLNPEYINNFELGWIQQIKKKGTFTTELFHRQISNKIERIKTIYQDNIVMNYPENVGIASFSGAEVTFDYTLTNWWRTNIGGTAFYFTVKGSAGDLVFDQESFSWTGRTTQTFTLKKDWRIQLTAIYDGPIAEPQGREYSNFRTNLGINKDFWKKRASVTLQVSDVFSTSRDKEITSTDEIYVYSLEQPKTPTFVLGFTLKLNNYKERKSNIDDDGGDL